MLDNIAALRLEAETLYHDAKLASFAGQFGVAEGKHLASALLYERLGDPALAARAYLRAVWYRIQSHSSEDFPTLISRAYELDRIQTAAGLVQAIEFCLLEGEGRTYAVCVELLGAAAAMLVGTRLPPAPSIDQILNVSVQISNLALDAAVHARWENWARSDQARVFYFQGLRSRDASERASMFQRAAELFGRHEIEYRAVLCRALSAFASAGAARSVVAAGDAVVTAITEIRSIGSFSRGVVALARALSAVSTVALHVCENRGYLHNVVQHALLATEEDSASQLAGTDEVFRAASMKAVTGWRDGISSELGATALAVNRTEGFADQRLEYISRFLQPFRLPVATDRASSRSVPRARNRKVTRDFMHIEGPRDGAPVAVFVHGWNGHFTDTWGNFPELLAADARLSAVAFFFWGFPTSLMGTHPGLTSVADALLTELSFRFPTSPIVVFAHSLGGLVVKAAILNALDRVDEVLLDRVQGVTLFATPHLGSDLASLGAPFSSQLKELRMNADDLTTLERQWVTKVFVTGKIRLTNVRGLSDVAVSAWSSITVNDDNHVLQGTHTSIVKPTSTDDLAYLLVLDRIQRGFGMRST